MNRIELALAALLVSLFASCGTAQCLAAPVCTGSDKQVTTCPTGASCYDVEICGTRITCQRTPDAGP